MRTVVPHARSSDESLLSQAQQGQVSALASLFSHYRVDALRAAHRWLGHHDDAEDAVQNGFLKAYQNLHQFRGQSSFKTWLLRIVSNAALDLGRRRKRTAARFESSSSDQEPVEPVTEPVLSRELERQELRQILDQALTQLSEVQRSAFEMYADDELTYREVAEQLQISIGTVMSRVFYARQRLQQELDLNRHHRG